MLQGLVSTRRRVHRAPRRRLACCEAPCFPANSRVLNSWFPQHERARANSIYSVGHVGAAWRSSSCRCSGSPTTTPGAGSSSSAGGIGVLFGVDLVRLLSRAARVDARQPGRARLHRRGRRVCEGQDRPDAGVLGEHSASRAAAADPDHFARAVLRQHGPDVLPDRLRELPGHAAPDAVDQARHLRVVPLHGGGGWRPGRRLCGRPHHQARRFGDVRAEAAGGCRADSRLVSGAG